MAIDLRMDILPAENRIGFWIADVSADRLRTAKAKPVDLVFEDAIPGDYSFATFSIPIPRDTSELGVLRLDLERILDSLFPKRDDSVIIKKLDEIKALLEGATGEKGSSKAEEQ